MSEEATAAPSQKKRGCGFWVMVGLAVIVGLGIIGSLAGPPKDKAAAIADSAAERAAQEAGAVHVSANELWKAYDANEAAAQAKYGTGPLMVTGMIERISLDFKDDPFVSFKTGNMFESTQADLAGEDKDKVAALAKGQTITVFCSKASEIAGTPMLHDCRLR